MEKEKKKFKIPHTYVIIGLMAVIAAVMTWIIPAGQFERITDEALNRIILVPGSYHVIESTPVGLFKLLVLFQQAMIESSGIIFFIFFAYGFVYMEIKCGAFDAAVGALLRKVGKRDHIIIPVFMLFFAIAGSTFGMTEETYGLLPVFMGIALALNYDALVGGAMVYIGVITGFAAATFNPFTLGVAQGIAELPLFSGLAFRAIVFVIFVTITTTYVMRYAEKVRKDPSRSIVADIDLAVQKGLTKEQLMEVKFTVRHKISILLLVVTMLMIMYGSIELGWYINEIAGLFIGMTIVVGLIQGYNFSKICEIFVESARNIVFGALVVGLAKTILLVMQEGNIIDTIINYLVMLASTGSKYLSAVMMLIVQNLLNFFIPSGSGQAATSMPIMIPLADMVGLTRQVSVLAYQFGDGFSNMFWPTSIATWCGVMGLPLDKWYKFVTPLAGILFVAQVILILIATAINLGPF